MIEQRNKTLYPSQVDAHQAIYSFWASLDPLFGLVSPTGSGKSTIIRSLVLRLESESARGRRGCKGVFVVVPQTHIQDSFRGPGKIRAQGEKTCATGPRTWLPLASTTTDRLAAMLGACRRPPWFGATCSYQLLHNALEQAQKTEGFNLSKRLLVVDEGHHAGASGLRKMIKLWTELGGRVLLATATPFRHDGREVFSPAQPRHVKTVSEHLCDTDNDGRPLAPQKLWICAERLHGYIARTKEELNGSACPKGVAGHATLAIIRRWVADSRPKLIVIVPQRGSMAWAARLEAAFTKKGARVLNAVGVNKKIQESLRRCLKREREATRWEDSAIDIIIACKRCDEGTDWPMCSHVYSIGFPSSLPLILQRLGRTGRGKTKIRGHTHPDDAVLVFFSPDPRKINSDAMKSHQQAALLTACCLSDYQTAQHYARRIGIFRAIDEGLRKEYDLNTARRLIGTLKPNEQDRAVARLAIERLAHSEPGLSVPETGKRLVQQTTENKLNKAQCLAGLMSLLEDASAEDFTTKDARSFRHALGKVVGERKKTNTGREKISSASLCVAEDLLAALNEVLGAYKHILVRPSKGVLQMTAMFTGQALREIGEQLREKLCWDKEGIRKYVLAFLKRTGRRPNVLEMREQDRWLRRNGSCARQLLEEMGLVQPMHSGKLFRKQVQAFCKRTGRRPTIAEMYKHNMGSVLYPRKRT